MERFAESLRLLPFFRRVWSAAERVLFLDYDGTLAPFSEQRERAEPYPEVRELLQGLLAAGHTRVVVVSGRPVDDLLPLLGLSRAPEIWGSHGWERRRPDGTRHDGDPGEGARETLRRAAARLRDTGFADAAELKPASLAIHWRHMEPEEREELRGRIAAELEPLFDRAGLELRPFDGGLEARAPGRDKGDAVRAVLDEVARSVARASSGRGAGGGRPGGAGSGTGEPSEVGSGAQPANGPDIASAYLGDDLTDEDAFAAIEGRGLPVLVRPRPRRTRAHLWLRPPGDLFRFLRVWHHGVERVDATTDRR